MAARIELVIDCADPDGLVAFWSEALGYRLHGASGPYRSIVPVEGDGPKLILQQVPEPKAGKNRMHLDIKADDIEAEAARLEAIGARRLRQSPVEEAGDRWILMADPEGNELCVCQC